MNPLVLPLNIGKDGTFKLSWKNRFYTAKGALVLQRKIASEADADDALESSQFVIKLKEFRASLRNKMLEALSPNSMNESSKNEVIGLVTKLNLKKGTILSIDDLRKAEVLGGSDAVDFMSSSAEIMQLSDTENQELITALQNALTAPVLEALRQIFVPFHAELSDTWKEQDLSTIQADKLVPFQILFPNGQPIERIAEGERYVIDDLYCTNPKCNCTDVTCVVLKWLPNSATEVAWGGFVWNSETDKFRTMPQFSNKFNAAEWFKQFNAGSAFELKLLLRSRQKFMRKHYIAARHSTQTKEKDLVK